LGKILGKPTTPTSGAGVTPKAPATGGDAAPAVTAPNDIYQFPSGPNGETPYDDAGNLNGGWQLDESNNPVWVGYQNNTVATDGAGSNTTVADNASSEGFQDEYGNRYDASGNLVFDSGTTLADNTVDTNNTVDTSTDTTVADTTWTNPDTGETYALGSDGSWSLKKLGKPLISNDTTVADNTDYTDYPVADNTDYSGDFLASKRGGSIRTKGGLPRFDEAGAVDTSGYSDTTEKVQPWQNVDATPQSLAMDSSSFDDSYVAPDVKYFADGSSVKTYSDGSTLTIDAEGNIVNGSTSTVDAGGNTTVTDGYGNSTRYDTSGNVIPAGGDRAPVGSLTSTGSGNNAAQAAANAAAKKAAADAAGKTPDTGVLDALKGYITQNPGLAGGAIGALLSSMMADSGSSAGPTQPADMSALTSFAPRTTDFGPGMAGGRTGTGSPVVSYQNYSQGYDNQYTPDERLYSDMGISGYLNEPEMTAYVDDQGNPVDQFGNPVDQYGNAAGDAETPTASEVSKEPAMATGGPATHYTYGRAINPAEMLGLGQGMKQGGLSQAHTVHSHHTNPVVNERIDFRQGSAVNGAGDGQSDDIPAWLADGEYVMDAELVAMLGNGSNKAGAKVLDKFREDIRAHKRSAPLGKIPPKAKSPLNYIKESLNG